MKSKQAGLYKDDAIISIFLSSNSAMPWHKRNDFDMEMHVIHYGDKMKGVWLSFPTTSVKLGMAKSIMGITDEAEGLDIAIKSKARVAELSCNLPYRVNLDEINYLAARLEALGEKERKLFSAVLLTCEYGEICDMHNVISHIDAFKLDSHGIAVLSNKALYTKDYCGPEDVPAEFRVLIGANLQVGQSTDENTQPQNDISEPVIQLKKKRNGTN